jgi:1D-myo-inositol 3-kinase
VTSVGERPELGGSAAYASAILRAAGVDFAVLANVGEDFLYRARVPPARIVAGSKTTSFVDEYRGGARVQLVRAVAPPIAPEDIRERCSIALAVPIAGEVPPPTLLRLREVAGVVVADAQGFVRTWDDSGRVSPRPPTQDVLIALSRVDYLKIGSDEAAVLDVAKLRRSCVVLRTEGDRGCTLLSRDAEHHVPAFAAREVDPTGAGDCFLAGFAVGLLRRLSPERAALLGNWCGARAVEVTGVPRPHRLPTLDEL